MFQFQAVCDLGGGHRTIGNQVIGVHFFYAVDDRSGYFLRFLIGAGAHTVGAVVAGAALDYLDLGTGNQRQNIFGFRSNILNPLVTGYMPGDFAQLGFKLDIQKVSFVSMQPFGWSANRIKVSSSAEAVRRLNMLGKPPGWSCRKHSSSACVSTPA